MATLRDGFTGVDDHLGPARVVDWIEGDTGAAA